jgi:alpha-tubulin suppressor-like RCC1 family protein
MRAVAGRSRIVKFIVLCAAVVAVVVTNVCATPHSSVARPATAVAKHSRPAIVELPSTVEHWGSFFGGKSNVNYDLDSSPVALTVPGTVAEIGTSNSTQYALLTNGSLYAWGLGNEGQLGDGRLVNSFTRPVRVHFPRGVKIASIPTDAMPFDAALAVDTKGNVWGWGQNGEGELCLPNTRTYDTPVKLPLSDVTLVAGASNHVLYDAHGALYACGGNGAGDLGDGSMRSTTRPMRVVGLDGSLVTELVASFANSGALLSNGEYFDWGYDGHGQLGDGKSRRSSDVPVRVNLPDPVTQVSQGGSIWENGQTLVMLSNGSLWAWGSNWHGQLGDGKTQAQASPVRFYPPAGVTYKNLATGAITSYAISTAGAVYAWGASTVGQVGDATMHTTLTPVRVASGAAMISSTANDVVVTIPGMTCHRLGYSLPGAVTKSISSSTRPRNSGSRSVNEVTELRMRCHAAAVLPGQPIAASTPSFHGWPGGTVGQPPIPSTDGLTAAQTSMNG